VRRIEAETGATAFARLRRRDHELERVESALGAGEGGAVDELERLRREAKEREAELARVRLQLVSGTAAPAGGEAEAAGIRLVIREVPPAPAGELRQLADVLRDKLGSGVVVLGTRDEGKATLLVAVTADVRARVPAGRLVKELAGLVGGSGGGRDDFAQAGGKSPERLAEALAQVPALVEGLALAAR
jgi:alanyl-tRNA synthetase